MVLAPVVTTAQVINEDFELYTTHNGLPHEHVSCLAADNEGFIWIGTLNGLARYDGHEFEHHYLSPKGPSHSHGNVISALMSDDQGLWAGTSAGVLAFRPMNGDWQTLALPLSKSGYPHRVTSLVSTPGWLFIGCFDGTVIRLDKASKSVISKTFHKHPITQLAVVGQQLMVVSENQSLQTDFLLQKSQQMLPGEVGGLPTYSCGAFLFDRGAYMELVEVPTQARKRIDLPRSTHEKRWVLPTDSGFVCLLNGHVSFMDSAGQVVDAFDMSTSQAHFSPHVSSALTTANGVTWLGTDRGLIKLVRSRYLFKKYRDGQRIRALERNYVRSIYSEGNDVWLGHKYDSITRLTFEGEHEHPVAQSFQLSTAGQTGRATVNTFLKLRNGDLMAGGLEGAWILRKEGFVNYPLYQELSISMPQIWTMAEDRMGRIWLGTLGNGLLVVDPVRETVQRLQQTGGKGLSSNTIWTLFTDREGTLWAGTQNGLDSVYYDENTISFTPLDQLVNDQLDGREVWQLLEDSLGNFWVGTTDNGLTYFDRTQRRLTHYHEEQGLKNEAVAGLALQSDRLWISTMNGLYELSTRSGKIKEWKVEDGLLSNEFNFKAVALSSWGELFLGSKSGLLSFDPSSVSLPQGTYPLKLQHLKVNGNEQMLQKIWVLDTRQRNLSVGFSLLEYAVPQKHQFRYRLQGFDDDWNYTGARQRVATYTNLPPGQYSLLVEGSLSKDWSTAGSAELAIEVTPRLSERGWFWSVLGLLLIGGTSLLIWLRFKQLRQKSRIQMQMAELERRMLTAQMNPHFLFNSMNAIQHFILTNEVTAAQTYLDRFSRLIRMFLDASKKKLISLKDEIALLKTYTELEQVRFEERFEVQFEISKELDLEAIEIPTSVIQPFVENAILHGLSQKPYGGRLCVRFGQSGKHLVVVVDDNGVGRSHQYPSRQAGVKHTPQGMKLAHDLAQAYSQLDGFPAIQIEIADKRDANENVLGTRVTINILIA